MNLLCPSCQKMLQVPEQYDGQQMRCPLCSNMFTVPTLPGTSLPAPAPPPFPSPPPLPKEEWYYVQSGKERQGPVLRPKLLKLISAGKLKPTDLVWKDGMPNWVVAGTHIELFPNRPLAAAPQTLSEVNLWYYSQEGAEHGPVDGAELKQLLASGKLAPTEMA